MIIRENTSKKKIEKKLSTKHDFYKGSLGPGRATAFSGIPYGNCLNRPFTKNPTIEK